MLRGKEVPDLAAGTSLLVEGGCMARGSVPVSRGGVDMSLHASVRESRSVTNK